MRLVEAPARPIRVEPLLPERERPRVSESEQPHARATARSRVLIVTPIACLLLALLFGLLAGLRTVIAPAATALLPLQILQPLHTLMSLSCIFSGIFALFVFAGEDVGARGIHASRRTFEVLLPAFIVLAAASIITGYGSGKEYLTWAPALTPLLVLLFVVGGVVFFRNAGAFARPAPEAAWLIGLGFVCMGFGLIEGNLCHVVSLVYARELSFEWHAIDIVVAGWNASLYGFGIIISAHAGKPLRAPWLYALAAFTFVSTFGHHHYMSPQPQTIKIIAVTASMLAGLSFVRHIRASRGLRLSPPTGPAGPFLVAAEVWTIFAIGSGILFAIPQVNLIIHGTYGIVAHSMGAMIGINAMLVLGGLAFYIGADPARARRVGVLVLVANAALLIMVLDLTFVGLVKGTLRLARPQIDFETIIWRELIPLPLFGTVLAVATVLICVELLRRDRGARRVPRAA